MEPATDSEYPMDRLSLEKSEPACLKGCDFDQQTSEGKTPIVRRENVLLPVENMTEDVRNEQVYSHRKGESFPRKH